MTMLGATMQATAWLSEAAWLWGQRDSTTLDPAVARLVGDAEDDPTLATVFRLADLLGVPMHQVVAAVVGDRTGDLVTLDTAAIRASTNILLQPVRRLARTADSVVALDHVALMEVAAACGMTPARLRVQLADERALLPPARPQALGESRATTTSTSTSAMWDAVAAQMTAARHACGLSPTDAARLLPAGTPPVDLEVPDEQPLLWWEHGRACAALPLTTYLRMCRGLGLSGLRVLARAACPAATSPPPEHHWLQVPVAAVAADPTGPITLRRWARHTLTHRGADVVLHIDALPALAACIGRDTVALTRHLTAPTRPDTRTRTRRTHRAARPMTVMVGPRRGAPPHIVPTHTDRTVCGVRLTPRWAYPADLRPGDLCDRCSRALTNIDTPPATHQSRPTRKSSP